MSGKLRHIKQCERLPEDVRGAVAERHYCDSSDVLAEPQHAGDDLDRGAKVVIGRDGQRHEQQQQPQEVERDGEREPRPAEVAIQPAQYLS